MELNLPNATKMIEISKNYKIKNDEKAKKLFLKKLKREIDTTAKKGYREASIHIQSLYDTKPKDDFFYVKIVKSLEEKGYTASINRYNVLKIEW